VCRSSFDTGAHPQQQSRKDALQNETVVMKEKNK